jgi:prolyl 4-hydroxylase
VTCQLYLNDGFEGGATRFMDYSDESLGYDVIPRTGSVLLFEHRLHHEGSMLISGRKYAMRLGAKIK